MGRSLDFLDPSKPLVDEVVAWLLNTRTRTVEGALSLAHVMVVVPTAQSGRSLRLALARAAAARGRGGLIPPKVVQPMHLVKPADDTRRAASPAESAVAFQQYVKTRRDEVRALDRVVWSEAFSDLASRFALFDQLEDIWRALAGRGLLMCDVPALAREALADEFGDELERWEQLARLERGYFDFLHALGVSYPTELVRAAKSRAAIVGDGVDEIVLPALADPVRVLGDVLDQQVAAGLAVTVLLHACEGDAAKFDDWGWPKTAAWTGSARPALGRLANGDLVCASNASALARLAAADYPDARSGRAGPTLALCDGDIYQSVASAFLNCGYVVHNPERHLLSVSSLGRLLKNLIALYPGGNLPWRECLAVLRSTDVALALGLDDSRRAAVLQGGDFAQNAFIPIEIPKGFAFPKENGLMPWQIDSFAAFCETGRALETLLASARDGASLAEFLRRMLKSVFAAHRTGGRADEKEFLAAAEGVRDFLAALESDLIAALNPSDSEFEALARRALDAVTYSLEPDAADAVRTAGWLELPWTAGREVALVGLHEGKVPDSIVGHPFLPDRLRSALGLVANADRLARDTWIFAELLASHAEHAVRAYVARASDAGDICRPSRLLYLCSDADLPARVKTLFGDLPAERSDRERRVEWPLALPDAVPAPRHLSASALDAYVKCPFTYLLKYGLKMRVLREKRELEANDFGTFVHDVLERYAKMQIARRDDQLTDAREIRRVILEEIVPVCRTRFANPTLNIELQLKSAEGRLALFAERQAEWASKGWRIREAECEIDDVVPELGVRIRGSIDRVDQNIAAGDGEKGWCLVDYKTWDEKKLTGRVVTSDGRMLSVQLPVYGMAYAAKHPAVPLADMRFSYFILGKNADETGVGEKQTMLTDRQVADSVAAARRAVEGISKCIFWPPGPTDDWKFDFSGLFVTDPATDLAGTDWAKAQAAKLEADRV